MGAIFISLLALFFIGLIFISLKNLQTDTDILNAQDIKVKNISETERFLIENWIKENNIPVPDGKGYRYLVKKYPLKPWFKNSVE